MTGSYRGVFGCVRAWGLPSGALIRTGKVCVLDVSLLEHFPLPPPVPTERLTGDQNKVVLHSYSMSLYSVPNYYAKDVFL